MVELHSPIQVIHTHSEDTRIAEASKSSGHRLRPNNENVDSDWQDNSSYAIFLASPPPSAAATAVPDPSIDNHFPRDWLLPSTATSSAPFVSYFISPQPLIWWTWSRSTRSRASDVVRNILLRCPSPPRHNCGFMQQECLPVDEYRGRLRAVTVYGRPLLEIGGGRWRQRRI